MRLGPYFPRCCKTAQSVMARFTSAHHVNRPSAQQLADRQSFAAATNPATVSPPHTNDMGFSTNPFSNYNPFGSSYDHPFSGLPSLAALSETPTRMQARTTTSVLGYNQSSREHSRHRVSRWLILVLPPAFITQSQGAFGSTLSSGPSSRLSQGLLIPLYPTVNQSVPGLSLDRMFYSMMAFVSDVRTIRRDRAGIQFPKHCGDLLVYACRGSGNPIYASNK